MPAALTIFASLSISLRGRQHLGRAADRIAATFTVKPRAEFRRLHRLDDGGIEPVDDLRRGLRRRPCRIGDDRLVTLEPRRFAHHRHIGQRLRARAARHRQRAQASGLHVRQPRGDAGEIHRHLPCHGVDQRRPAALVGHVRDVDLRHHLQQFTGQMRHAAGTEGCVADRTRVCLCQLHEVAHRFRRKRRMHHDHQRQPRDLRTRREIVDGVVIELLVN